MALGKQLPIRLDPDVETRLAKIAEDTGTTKSAIIRLLADTFVKQVIDSKGKITLPPDWSQLLPARDKRAEKKPGTKKAP